MSTSHLSRLAAMDAEDARTPAQATPTPPRQAFEELSTETLRELAARTGYSRIGWAHWDRGMLLAFHLNRSGRWVPAVAAGDEVAS